LHIQQDLAKIFAGSGSEVNDIEKEICEWHMQKFSLYEVNSITIVYPQSIKL